MKRKEKNQKKIREPKVSEEALTVQADSEEHVTLQNLSEIDPELLTGKEVSEQTEAEPAEKESEPAETKEAEPEKKTEAVFELDRLAGSGDEKSERLKRNAGIAFVITAVLIVLIVAMLSFFIDTGMDKSF